MISIKNFQSHADTQLDIKEGAVNAIVGPSRSGKSAIFRAIESLCLNSMIDRRDGSKETEISWRGVTRRRSNTVNQYELDHSSYKALRSGVPRQISDKLRVREINFRPQHDPYFLLNETPGAVARMMNEWADLGMIDYVARKLASDKREVEQLINGLIETKEQREAQIKALDWAQEADIRLREAEVAVEVVRQTEANLGLLVGVLDKMEAWAENPIPDPAIMLVAVDSLLALLKGSDLPRLVGVLDKIQETRIPPSVDGELGEVIELLAGLDTTPVNGLRSLLDDIHETGQDLEGCPDPKLRVADVHQLISSLVFGDMRKKELSFVLSKINKTPTMPDPAGSIEEIGTTVENLQSHQNSLASILDLCYKSSEAVGRIGGEIEEAQTKFNNLLAEAGQCPLCGR